MIYLYRSICPMRGESSPRTVCIDVSRPQPPTHRQTTPPLSPLGPLGPQPARAQEMKKAGVPAGLIAHNAAIGACDKGGEWSSTLRVLGEMRAAGIRPDVISYAGAIRYDHSFSSCALWFPSPLACRVLVGLELLFLAKLDRQIPPRIYLYSDIPLLFNTR